MEFNNGMKVENERII